MNVRANILTCLLAIACSACGLEEVEDTEVEACRSQRSNCSNCCVEQGFDFGSYDIMLETCFCKTEVD